MELIVITHPEMLPGEAAIINQLFAHGLARLHVRKPEATQAELQALLEQIDSPVRERIALHQHHELAAEFGITGLHFTEKNRLAKHSEDLEALKSNGFIISTSLHDPADLETLPHCFDYAFLGPVFDSISKENYKANLKTIIDKLLGNYPGSKVVIHHPIWYSTNTYNSSRYLAEGLERLNSYIPEIDALVSEYADAQPGRVFKGDTKAYKYFKKHAEKLFKPENGQQGVFFLHPNEEGVAILGKYWGKAMAKKLL